MSIFVARETEAKQLLDDENFCREWQLLLDSCSWGTVFQSPGFIKIWTGVYDSVFERILLYQKDAEGKLCSMFPLASERTTGRICAAGDYHAEYQTWLASPENADDFIAQSIEALSSQFPGETLRLLFLAPGTPLGWQNKDTLLGKQSELRIHPRPLAALGDGEKFAESLRKKNNKNRKKQLTKIGEINLEDLKTPAELESVFDQIEDFSKLRMSALHNVTPVYDPLRKPLHIALSAIPGLVNTSLLKVGERIASAIITFKNQGQILLGTTSMSPFLAKHSPGHYHLLLLANELAKRKIGVLDLSPGTGYKDRLATHYDNAYSLEVFFSKSKFVKHKIQRTNMNFAKSVLAMAGISKDALFTLQDKLKHKFLRANYLSLPLTLAKNFVSKIYDFRECRIYAFDITNASKLTNPGVMKRDSISDLLKYEPLEGWQFTTQEFHQTVLERFENNTRSYTYADDDKLLHYGWMNERQTISDVYEVGQTIELPPDSAVLFDYYTHPDARGRGLYRDSLRQGLHDAAKIPGTKKVFIAVLADNKGSRHVIEKVGFEYCGSLFTKTLFGSKRKWQVWEKPLLENTPEQSQKLPDSELTPTNWKPQIPAVTNTTLPETTPTDSL